MASPPPGKTHVDKFVLPSCDEGVAIGCANVIRGHTKDQVAFICLLMFVETAQGKSCDPRALREVELLSASWGCRLTEPNIDDLLSIVEESVATYKVCQARIDAVEAALEKALNSAKQPADGTAQGPQVAKTSTHLLLRNQRTLSRSSDSRRRAMILLGLSPICWLNTPSER